jgi:PKD repeat protein
MKAMDTMNHLRRFAAHVTVAVVAIGAAACTVDNKAMPALSGPSGLGMQVIMVATPDRLPRDGSSQSVVLLEARDAKGKGISGQRVTLGITTGASLSQAEVVTGPDGLASFAVIAPTQDTVINGNVLVVAATPVTGNFDNAATQTITIALTGVSNSSAPSPAFTVTPAAPEINQVATFDATTTTDEGGQCLSACTYAWDFDDGATASGRIATHAFSQARSYNVALTVTDSSGLVVVLRKLVTPTTPAEPTVTLAVAPSKPVVNQLATFIAVGTPAANHQIVQYEWNFGDGKTDTTPSGSVTHTYSARGIFTATVRAKDDLGRFGSASLQLDLTTGVPTGINASFFFSPIAVKTNTGQVQFNANESTPSNGASISTYKWNWGDLSANGETSDPIILHTFPGIVSSYSVQLTIVDSQGRTAITRQTVSVAAP